MPARKTISVEHGVDSPRLNQEDDRRGQSEKVGRLMRVESLVLNESHQPDSSLGGNGEEERVTESSANI